MRVCPAGGGSRELAVHWEDGEPYCCNTAERIKNLHPLAVMRTNPRRCTPPDVWRDIVEISLVTLFLLAVAALVLGTLLVLLRWTFDRAADVAICNAAIV